MMIEAIVKNKRRVMPVIAFLQGEYLLYLIIKTTKMSLI